MAEELEKPMDLSATAYNAQDILEIVKGEQAAALDPHVSGFLIRSVKRIVSVADPGGAIEEFFGEMEHESRVRKEERLALVIAHLCNGVAELQKRGLAASPKIDPLLLDHYGECALRDPAAEKVEYFRNLLLNGLASDAVPSDSIRFDLDSLRDLSYSQIRILVFLLEARKSTPNSQQGIITMSDFRMPQDPPPVVSIGEIASAVSLGIPMTIRSVANLIGKGLVIRPAKLDLDDWTKTTKVGLADFAVGFIESFKTLGVEE